MAPSSGSHENPSSPNQTAIDIEKALSQLDGDRELLHEVVNLFVETAPALLEDLRSAALTGDGRELQAAAHSLKGAASNICAEPVRRTTTRGNGPKRRTHGC
jgi:two-component system, sensor histidine kinase and response regulator